MKTAKNTLSVVAGIAAAIVTFLIGEYINASIFPAPTTLDYKDADAVKTFYNNQPLTVWVLVLITWAIGSFLCGLLIKLISKSNRNMLPLIAGVLLTLSGILNIFSLPHPTWFIVVGLLIFIPSVLMGHKTLKSY